VALTYSGDTFTTPDNRTYAISAELRVYTIRGEQRIYSVTGD
jgi:hypothetical protein